MCGAELYHRRLGYGHQRHVAVCRHHYGSLIVGLEVVRHIYAGGTVRSTYYGYACGVLQLKAQQHRHSKSKEYTELSRRAKEHHLWVGKQRPKVYHGAYAYEQQQREKLGRYARVEHRLYGLGIDKGQIYEYRPKAHGQEQRGLHLPLYRAPYKGAAYYDHNSLLPGKVQHIPEKLIEKLHRRSSLVVLFYK